jgi:glycosyltransferase involved in cell wall biosynthesis
MADRRPRVVYWNHSPTPYFVDRFNAVVERDGIDFEAWFNDRREAIRSWDVDESRWLFPARYIPRRSTLGWRASVPVAELRQTRPDLLVQEYDRSHLVGGFLAAERYAGRSAFRVLPNYDTWSERTWWREAGKRFAFHAVDAAKVPGEAGAELARRYGLPDERIHRVTQSVDLGALREGAEFARRSRPTRRAELGLTGCVFVYSGRLWSGKGADHLFDAYERVLATGVRASLLLLGDGPDEGRYRSRAEALPGVVFAGFVQADRIASFYALADVMVFPTLGDPHGLVVEEAMAVGLPVIASTAAGDIAARVPEGEAGYLVPPGEAESLARRMIELATDLDLRTAMGARGAELCAERDHSRYAADFEEFALAALATSRRTGAAATLARFGGLALAGVSLGRRPAAMVSAAPPPGSPSGASAV